MQYMLVINLWNGKLQRRKFFGKPAKHLVYYRYYKGDDYYFSPFYTTKKAIDDYIHDPRRHK